MRRALLLLALFTAAVAACKHGLSLHARGCGSSSNATVEVEDAMMSFLCAIGDTVVTAPPTDVVRLQGSYLILVEMPGVASSDVSIKVEAVEGSHLLSIAGVSHDQEPAEFSVRGRGAFTKLFARKFILPGHADAARISHRIENGLLRVTVPLVPGSELVQDLVELEPRSDEAHSTARGLRAPPMDHTIENADRLVRPEALVATKVGACVHDPSVIAISPLVDILELPDSYVIVAEMPGAQSAQVEVTCSSGGGGKDGEEAAAAREIRGMMERDWFLKLMGEAQGTGCIASIAGVARDEDGGHAVRLERGGASTKVFARRLYFPLRYVEDRASYNLTGDGLLRVALPKRVPSLWESVMEFWHKDVCDYLVSRCSWDCVLLSLCRSYRYIR